VGAHGLGRPVGRACRGPLDYTHRPPLLGNETMTCIPKLFNIPTLIVRHLMHLQSNVLGHDAGLLTRLTRPTGLRPLASERYRTL
jgi:hypothetical protein